VRTMIINKIQRKVVVVGGVALGAGVAAKVRRMDEDAEVIIIERGPYVSFANCGLPYYLGDVITHREALLLHTPQSLRARFNIDVRIEEEAISLDRARKVVFIRRLVDGVTYEQPYDDLVLAMGAKPIVPPVPGITLDGIFRVRSVPDVDEMKAWIAQNKVRHAVVIGAGFIGLETVENLVHLGIKVTLIEKARQVLPPFDTEMTALALRELRCLEVDVILGDGITGFEGLENAEFVLLESGMRVKGDMFVLGLGVQPDNAISLAAGLETGIRGSLKVNEYLQTSDPHIYSGGDLAEIIHRVDGKTKWIPLAAAANKQARIIGTNIVGGKEKFRGAQGTSIVRVGDVTLAMTGLTEREATSEKLDFFVSYNTSGHHASYYPGATDLTIKLVVERPSGRILGGQVAGDTGVDKRIDVIAMAISAGMNVRDLEAADLAYAPPFSSAKDPVIMAAMAAENILDRRITAVYQLEDVPQARILDVRNAVEVKDGMLLGAVNIPLDELRQRAAELDMDESWIVYCRSGQRSYFASTMLNGLGFKHVYNLSGGFLVQQMRLETMQVGTSPRMAGFHSS